MSEDTSSFVRVHLSEEELLYVRAVQGETIQNFLTVRIVFPDCTIVFRLTVEKHARQQHSSKQMEQAASEGRHRQRMEQREAGSMVLDI